MGGGEERRQKGASDGICRALIPGHAVPSAAHALCVTLSPVARGSRHNYSWLEGMKGSSDLHKATQ